VDVHLHRVRIPVESVLVLYSCFNAERNAEAGTFLHRLQHGWSYRGLVIDSAQYAGDALASGIVSVIHGHVTDERPLWRMLSDVQLPPRDVTL